MIAKTRLETGGPWFNQTQFHLNTRLEQAFQPIEIDNTHFICCLILNRLRLAYILKMKRFERFRRRWKSCREMQESFLPNKNKC